MPRVDRTGAFHFDASARRTVTASPMVWPLGFSGSTGTATVRQVSAFGAPSGQVVGVATAAGAVVVGAALVGGSVTGAAVVLGAVVAGRAMVDAGVDAAVLPSELQLVDTSASAMPRHEVTVLQRMGTPIRS